MSSSSPYQAFHWLYEGKKPGFMLIEVIASVAIIAGMAGLSLVGLLTMYQSGLLDATRDQMISALQVAQLNAQSGRGGRWRLTVATGVVCAWTDADACVPGTEQVLVSVPSSVILSGLPAVTFAAMSGHVELGGEIHGVAPSGESWTITIHKRGFSFVTGAGEVVGGMSSISLPRSSVSSVTSTSSITSSASSPPSSAGISESSFSVSSVSSLPPPPASSSASASLSSAPPDEPPPPMAASVSFEPFPSTFDFTPGF